MLKILLAVVSCHSRPEFSDAIRNTWASEVPNEKADILFFLGRGPNIPKKDEVHLDCDDGYFGLPEKVRAIFKWGYDHGYSHVVKIDDDVIMNPIKFLNQDFYTYDFLGMGKSPDSTLEVLQMPYGFCYTLSRKAIEVVLSKPLPKEDNTYEHKHDSNDEYWIAWVLHSNRIFLHVNWNCRLWTGRQDIYPELPDEYVVCVHMHNTKSRPEEVHEMCRIWRDKFINTLGSL